MSFICKKAIKILGLVIAITFINHSVGPLLAIQFFGIDSIKSAWSAKKKKNVPILEKIRSKRKKKERRKKRIKAKPPAVKLVRAKNVEKHILGLELKLDEMSTDIRTDPKTGKQTERHNAVLLGIYSGNGQIQSKNGPIKLDDRRRFQLLIPLEGRKTFFDLESVGSIEDKVERFLIRRKNLSELEKEAIVKDKNFVYTFGAGYTTITYKERGEKVFQETAVTAKAGVAYLFSKPHWSLSGNGYHNVLVLDSTPADFNARYLGINGRVGYTAFFLGKNWPLSLNAGLGFISMTASKSTFGFAPVISVQIFPVLRYKAERNEVYLYGKVLPLDTKFDFSSGELEIAGGLGWIIRWSETTGIVVSADYSTLTFLPAKRIPIYMQTLTGGLGLTF